ncbi:MAG: class I SAM-dependent methyltransferase [Burkholderiaceae bacterium]
MSGGDEPGDEPEAVAQRYARRTGDDRYSMQRPDVWHTVQERQRAMLSLFARHGMRDLSALKLLEVGCGAGGNLLELLRLGFAPQHLTGVELLAPRCAQARAVLPAGVALVEGDAVRLTLPAQSQDIVLVATVFSSLLDDAFQNALADAMWRWVRPGGGVLWYDLAFDNPRNADVRGMPLARVRALFPHAGIDARRVTLAPPLARVATRLNPTLYTVLNVVPWLRTHRLAWLGKAT